MKRGHVNKTWIKIQQLSEAVFDFDDTPATWDDLYELRAKVEPKQSSEVTAANKQEGQTVHEVSFRYQPAITTEMRILIDDETIDDATDNDQTPVKRTLHIAEIIDVGDRQRDLVLECIER